ncbi:MAG: hypothetical protein LBB46_05995 [Coriobacteriaceae bacterium]|nr:hypothetical protein [Coriobacteriaceae bacterium]
MTVVSGLVYGKGFTEMSEDEMQDHNGGFLCLTLAACLVAVVAKCFVSCLPVSCAPKGCGNGGNGNGGGNGGGDIIG